MHEEMFGASRGLRYAHLPSGARKSVGSPGSPRRFRIDMLPVWRLKASSTHAHNATHGVRANVGGQKQQSLQLATRLDDLNQALQ